MLHDLTTHVQGSIDGKQVRDIDLLRHEVARSRTALLMLKAKIGPERMKELLREETEKSSALIREWLEASDGRFTPSTADLTVTGGNAADFLAWLEKAFGSDALVFGAHPEHYFFQTASGDPEQIETVGAWGNPIFVTLDFDREVKALVGPGVLDEAYPIRMLAVGTIASDPDKGGVAIVHQLADTEQGFKVKLAIYFPAATDPLLLEGHRVHLAVEFTNWINMYLTEIGIRSPD